jgi:hypothetical protein
MGLRDIVPSALCAFLETLGDVMESRLVILVFAGLLFSANQANAYGLVDCFNALKYDSQLQPISEKVELARVGDVTFGMLANEDRPTSEEKQAIFKWATKRDQCFNAYPPPNNLSTQAVRDGYNSVQSLILDLYKGAITYGQFAKQSRETMEMVVARIQGSAGQYQRQQAQQQQYQQQREDYQYQACMNRARDQFAQSACNMERAGRQIGGALSQ